MAKIDEIHTPLRGALVGTLKGALYTVCVSSGCASPGSAAGLRGVRPTLQGGGSGKAALLAAPSDMAASRRPDGEATAAGWFDVPCD